MLTAAVSSWRSQKRASAAQQTAPTHARGFVDATGYVTLAERPLNLKDYPNASPDLLHPGGLVFQGTGSRTARRRLAMVGLHAWAVSASAPFVLASTSLGR